MSEHDTSQNNGPAGGGRSSALDLEERGLRPPPGLSFWRRLWWWFDFIIVVKLARLRFIAILAAVGGVIAYWDTLTAYYEKWTRPASTQATAAANIEFWCPMHPTIVREQPDKCPICGMPLSKRKKGEFAEDEPLPPGVVSRVQLTPYRIALAGIQTAEVGYRPLTKDITTVGFVEFDERKLARISARVTGKSRIDKLYANVTGQTVKKGDPLALLYSPDLVVTAQNLLDARRGNNQDLLRMARERLRLWGIEADQIKDVLHTDAERGLTHLVIRSPIGGHVIKKYQVEGEYVDEGARLYDVADLSTIWIEAQVYEDEVSFLREGLFVHATAKSYPNRVFSGKVAFVYPHMDASTRTLRVRFDMDNAGHELRPGMYATVKLQVPVNQLTPFSELARDGKVLAVPDRAVIDTGSRKFVYREAEPGVYEGVEVELGPRSGGFYPVVKGLEAGDKVATAGSFLIDAETRLTGGVGSTYFGASAGPQAERRGAAVRPSMVEDEEAKIEAALAKLSPDDRKFAEAQRYCPVLEDNRLGSMGVPVKVILRSQPVFLCCKGCLSKARANEQATLDKAVKRKAEPSRSNNSPAPISSGGSSRTTVKAKAALAKLSSEDRRLAEAQGFCPETDEPLGSMGVPVKLMVKGQPVFLCCKSCEDDANEHPDQTLAKVEELKKKVVPSAKGGQP